MTFSAAQSIPLRVRTFSAIRSRSVPRPAGRRVAREPVARRLRRRLDDVVGRRKVGRADLQVDRVRDRQREVEDLADPRGRHGREAGARLGHRPNKLRRKKVRFAGRSARRRMRYGNQSGPCGVATSTLNPRARSSSWSWRGCRRASGTRTARAGSPPARRTRSRARSACRRASRSPCGSISRSIVSMSSTYACVHLGLLLERDLGRLEVGALHEPQVRARAGRASARSSGVRKRYDWSTVPTLCEPVLAQALVDAQRRVDEARVLHVDADEVVELVRRARRRASGSRRRPPRPRRARGA